MLQRTSSFPFEPPAPFEGVKDVTTELRWGWGLVAAFLALLLASATFIRLDAAAYAPAVITVSGNRQAVQHREGGTVASLNVREGQHVRKGQILLTLTPGDVGASERSAFSQWLALEARRSRLMAERDQLKNIPLPQAFEVLSGSNRAEALRILFLQQAEFATNRTALTERKRILAQRVSQIRQQITGFRGQSHANVRQQSLISEELDGSKGLATKGWVSLNRIRALERSKAELEGGNANLTSNVARAQEQIGELESQLLSIDTDAMQSVAKELQQIDAQISELTPRLGFLRDQLSGTQIRSPADGTVYGLEVFTVGAVIAPGQKVMEIVPDRAPLVIRAQIAPTDADDVHMGQAAEVRILALHERDIPILNGSVTYLSADSLVDERTGAAYFSAEVTVPPEEMKEIARIKNDDASIRPGLPVEVLIPLRKRTAFQYLMEPLTQALWRSFHEH